MRSTSKLTLLNAPLHCQTHVIYEKDADIGDIGVLDMASTATPTPLPSHRIEPERLAHFWNLNNIKNLTID